MTIPEILDSLEAFHGPRQPDWPLDPYLFIVWWHCGYPASDTACAKGWQALQEIGTAPQQLLEATPKQLTAALKAGGMVPELRALRLKEIAQRIEHEFGGDLRAHLTRANLKKFSNIADPGADRILLFAGASPVAAVPSNCPHVLVRIARGPERENYGVNYRFAQELIDAQVAATLEARQRGYLLLKHHGQTLCRRTKPKCAECPVREVCRFALRS